MPIRPIESNDERALGEFLGGIPEEDRNFFKEDVTDPTVLDRWLMSESRDIRLVSTDDDGSIQAVATVAPGVGRSSHVGDVRLVVAARARRQGVGRDLAKRALVRAIEDGMKRLTVEVAAEQQGAIDMFRDLGFVPEALLRDQLRDEDGRCHDIVILAHSVDDNWSTFLAAGLQEATQ